MILRTYFCTEILNAENKKNGSMLLAKIITELHNINSMRIISVIVTHELKTTHTREFEGLSE